MAALAAAGLSLAAAAGCSTGGAALETTPDNPSLNVTQGGAQDFARVRAIIEAGDVPSTDLLDPVGFFAEHAIDIPDATCGKDVCVHPFLAVAPRFNGDNWTMAFMGMNTPVDPSKLERPPVHLVIAMEQSEDTGVDSSAAYLGATGLIGHLRPEDRVSVVGFDQHAERFLLAGSPTEDPTSITNALGEIATLEGDEDGSVALYDGIAAAERAFDDAEDAGFVGVRRVLLITSGAATAGITDTDMIAALGEEMVKGGSAFGVLGVGKNFEAKVPSALGSMGAGTYAYAENDQDFVDLMDAEGKTTLFPLAEDFVLEVTPSAGYRVGRVYGTNRAKTTKDGVSLEMPALFIGLRDGESDVGGSRRGGGGGLFVELLADPTLGIAANQPAFQVNAKWKVPATGAPASLEEAVLNKLAPGQNPDGMWWELSDEGQNKAYMMLNMYLALRGSLDFYEFGDCPQAMGVIDMMQDPATIWLGKFSDLDIQDDNDLLLKLRVNIENACAEAEQPTEPVEPDNFEGGCCFL